MRSVVSPILATLFLTIISTLHPATASAQSAQCSGGVVALRFDDGPVPETNAILDALKQHNLRATFFVIGTQVEQHPDIAQRIIREGHELANHSWSHPPLADLTPAEVVQELKLTQDIVRRVTGFRMKLAGPPYGSTSDAVRLEMTKLGLREVMKSRDSEDWDGAERWAMFNRLTLTPPGGIYLLHDWVPSALALIPDIAWYFRTYWQRAPICAGRVVATTEVNPVLDWQGMYYHAKAAEWPRR